MYIIVKNNDYANATFVSSIEGMTFARGDKVEVHGDSRRGKVVTKAAGRTHSTPLTETVINNRAGVIIL